MASERDRAHMRAIALAMEEENRQATHADAKRSPGENIEQGLKLSAFASSVARQFGTVPDQKDPVPLIALWRALQARRSNRGPDAERGPGDVQSGQRGPE